MKQDLQLGTMRSLVLRAKINQEEKGERTGRRDAYRGTRVPLSECGIRAGNGDELQTWAPEKSPDATAESPYFGPTLPLHVKLVP